jgi:Protein of unknown function (DUF3179)
MTISSGSRSPPSSRTPRSAAEGSRFRPSFRAWRILSLLGALAAATIVLQGDDEHQRPTPDAPREAGAGTRTGGTREPTFRRLRLPSPAAPRFGWHRTDFSRHSVPLSEFVPGGPGKDGIPAIDRPRFTGIRAAEPFLDNREPVAVVELAGRTRAYPLAILIWHEIVNDEIAGEPVAVTYCPLCNSTVAFDRRLDGRELEFGTTGALRNADLVMYDRQTQSWWQQLTAEAVVGKLTGERLEVLPSQILNWSAFKRLHPDGEVLSVQTGYSRPYGENPYLGYDAPRSLPPTLGREADQTLPPKSRVAAVRTGQRSAVVFPFFRLRREAPLNARVGGRPIVVFFDPTVTSPLDASTVWEGRRVGAAAVFERSAGGWTLGFEAASEAGTFRDAQTGSTWDMRGRAVAGPMEGNALEQVPHDDQFWFALAAFYPNASIRR